MTPEELAKEILALFCDGTFNPFRGTFNSPEDWWLEDRKVGKEDYHRLLELLTEEMKHDAR